MKISSVLLFATMVVSACGTSTPLFAWPDTPSKGGTASTATASGGGATVSTVESAQVVPTRTVAQASASSSGATTTSASGATTSQGPQTTIEPTSQVPTSQVQTPQAPTSAGTASAAPENLTTVVPVQSQDSVVRPTAQMSQTPSRRASASRRQARNLEFIAKLDTLVKGRNYQFVPNSMQEMPSGELQFIYNFYYYLAVVDDHVEVHLPTVRGGFAQYIEILNFDTFAVSNYCASQTHYGWAISFNVKSSAGNSYAIAINLYTSTGEAQMSLMSTGNMVKYIGRLEQI